MACLELGVSVICEFFAWVATDFQLYTHFVSLQLDALKQNPDVDLVYPGVMLTFGEIAESRTDPFSLMQETPGERLETLYNNLMLGTAIYGLSRAALYRDLFLCPPTGVLPIWTSSRFFHFGDLQLLTSIVLKTKVLQIENVLIERDRVDDGGSYGDELARLERYLQHQRTNIGLPSFVGLNEILVRLFQMPFEIDEILSMSSFIMRVLFERFSSMFDYELNEVCDALSKREYGRSWDESHTIMNANERPAGSDFLIQHVRYIYDDLHIASLYSSDERVSIAHRVCSKLLNVNDV